MSAWLVTRICSALAGLVIRPTALTTWALLAAPVALVAPSLADPLEPLPAVPARADLTA